MFRKNMTLGIIILILTGISFPSFAIELKTAAQESAPKYFKLEDNTMGGICVDIMQAIESVESEIQFNGYQKFLPFKRLQKYLEDGRLDVFFGFKETVKRKEKYSFLDIPLYQINYVVAVRIDDKVKINSFDDVRSLGEKGRMLTVSGTAASIFLHKEGGLLIADGAESPTILLKMLMFERGRFAFYHDLGLQSIIKNETLEKKIKILPVSFLTYYHYAVFSKNTPRETIDKVRTALEKLKDNGELAKIHSKYNLLK